MSETVSPIIEYYQKCNEDIRMEDNPLEYLRCKEIILRYLLKDHMDILDVGGATGAFSFWLAEKGHNVSLIDFAPKHKKDSEIKILIGCTEEEKAVIMRFHNDSEYMKGTMIRRVAL